MSNIKFSDLEIPTAQQLDEFFFCERKDAVALEIAAFQEKSKALVGEINNSAGAALIIVTFEMGMAGIREVMASFFIAGMRFQKDRMKDAGSIDELERIFKLNPKDVQ